MSNKLIINKHLLNEIILEELDNMLLEKKAEIVFKKNNKQLQEIVKKYEINSLKEDVSSTLNTLQFVLDVLGMIPGAGEAADATNVLISLARGQITDAALSTISLVPGIGDIIAKPLKGILKTQKVIPPALKKQFIEYFPKIVDFINSNFPKLIEKIPGLINKVPMLNGSKKQKIIQTINQLSVKYLPKIQTAVTQIGQKISKDPEELLSKMSVKRATSGEVKANRRDQVFNKTLATES